VADHGLHIFRVGRAKPGQPGQPPWYLLDGSIMVALPDILIVKGQHFVTLPLNHLAAEAGPVVLGGRRTCDSDDFYPRGDLDLILPLVDVGDKETSRQGNEENPTAQLSLSPNLPISRSLDLPISRSPDPQSPIPNTQPLLIAFFGTGAYQAMLAGEGGAHHCLAPEAAKLIIEEQAGAFSTRVIGEQSWADVLSELGYQ
jgi:arginine decarboxylase